MRPIGNPHRGRGPCRTPQQTLDTCSAPEASNARGGHVGTISAMHSHRMLAVLWTVDTADFTRPGTQTIVQRAVDSAKNGAIILMHDGGGDRSETLAAVPAIVHRLRVRGFQLVTVPQMLLHDPPSKRQAHPTSGGA